MLDVDVPHILSFGTRRRKSFSHRILERVLGLEIITREKFFTLLEVMNRKNLSSYEFKLLNITTKQHSPS
jgi:hypothetical protein